LPGDTNVNWRGPATGFDESQWAATLSKTLRMDDMISRLSAMMDKYDPKKQVGLYVDEWGTWYDQEAGTHPGFLYQQNSLARRGSGGADPQHLPAS
jgi:alpha-N-arabinofuranosidase